MDFAFWKKKTVKESPMMQLNKKNYKNFMVKAIGFITSQGASRGDFSLPEFNLSEIKKAADADSYVKIALMRFSDLMYKAGYDLKSSNDEAVEYLNMRLRIMSFATGKPMDILFQEVADDLIKYSNSFLVKSRVDKLMPGINARGVFNDKPIGGYFRVDADSIKIKRDKSGKVLKYEQTSGFGESVEFQPTEVIHIYMDKDAGNAFGTPRLIAALEDVKLLRKIEGNIVSLIYRFAIPIYQWIVGIPQTGFQATDQEIRDAQREIENMPMDGVIVTNEKTKITAIGAEGNALDASSYLQYFEKRVFTALGVSETLMGRGATSQNADTMEAQVHDSVKRVQKVISIFVENYMLNELLLEGGFNPILNEEDIVKYEFNEISLDTKIKLENHEMLKYQSNLNTFDEARHAMGKKSNVDENELYMHKIENKAALLQIDAKTKGSLEIAKQNADNAAKAQKASNGGNGNGQTKNTKANKDVTTRNRPTNQHGTTSVKIKEDFEVVEKAARSLKSHKKNYLSIYKKYENLCSDIIDGKVDIDMLLPLCKDSIMSEIKTFLKMESFDGINKAVKDINGLGYKNYHLIPNIDISLESFYEEAENTLKAILKDIKTRIGKTEDPQHIKAVFKTLEYRIRFLLEFLIPKVYWYSYIKTGSHFKIDKAYILFDGSDDKKDHPSEINTKAFSVDDIPAYHSFCDCKITFKAGERD